MNLTKQEISVLRELAKKFHEAACDPVNIEREKGWRALNGLKPIRPMVIIDQLPWNEFPQEELTGVVTSDPYWQRAEKMMRRMLFRFKYIPGDAIIKDNFTVTKEISGIHDFGLRVNEDTASIEESSEVRGHYYHDQLETDEIVDALTPKPLVYYEESTLKHLAEAHELFDGILPVVLNGVNPPNDIWDHLSMYRGVENPLYDMAERPEFIHKIMRKFTDLYIGNLLELEKRGLLGHSQETIHCTQAFVDELPKPGFDPNHVRACDTWAYGLAQMLSSVSPAMFEEFEVDYCKEWAKHIGLVYYGCCDPLDRKMEQVRKIPNVRKISMSPWTTPEVGAAAIAGDYVFSSKPNPAHLAAPTFDGDMVRAYLTNIKKAAESNNCPVEFILKDVSTVKHDFNRLVEWEKIAMEVAKA